MALAKSPSKDVSVIIEIDREGQLSQTEGARDGEGGSSCKIRSGQV